MTYNYSENWSQLKSILAARAVGTQANKPCLVVLPFMMEENTRDRRAAHLKWNSIQGASHEAFF